MSSEYKAAGILPWAVVNGTPFALVGAEPRRTGPGGSLIRTMWSNFGGLREASDDGDSILTASREFAEETLGVFASASVTPESVLASTRAMAATLRSGDRRALQVSHKLRRGEYHFFVTQTPFVEPLFLHLAAQSNLATGAIPGGEKTAFAWVPFCGLLRTVAQVRPRYFLDHATRRAAIRGHSAAAAACSGGEMQLHPCFATSLRMAMGAGLEARLAEAAERAAAPSPLLALLPGPSPESCSPAVEAPGHHGTRPGKRCRRSKNSKNRRRRKRRQEEELDPRRHMLYWLQQDEVLEGLRFPSAAGSDAVAPANIIASPHSQVLMPDK